MSENTYWRDLYNREVIYYSKEMRRLEGIIERQSELVMRHLHRQSTGEYLETVDASGAVHAAALLLDLAASRCTAGEFTALLAEYGLKENDK